MTIPSLFLLHDQTELSILKLKQLVELPAKASHLFNLSVTNDEFSLVAPKKWLDNVEKQMIEREDGWQAIKINQHLNFDMIGILANISQALANKEISIFVISTFNTDYILVKSESIGKALSALRQQGHKVESGFSLDAM